MTWVLANLDLIADRTWWHLVQAVPAIMASFVLAIVIAKVAGKRAWVRPTVGAASGLLYAIPSLPLFIVLPILLGTGLRSPLNIAVALTLYGLALMVPGAISAFRSVDPAVLGSATAQGFAPVSKFFLVELPLAGPALLATLRVVSVSTISLVTVGGVLGIPSLGTLFTDGFQRGIQAEVLAGIVFTAALALLVDMLLIMLGRVLMPWTRTHSVANEATGNQEPSATGGAQNATRRSAERAGTTSADPASQAEVRA